MYGDKELKHQRRYGQRGNECWNTWLLRKRTINIACTITACIRDTDFVEFEMALHIRATDEKVKKFISSYEFQMEEAYLKEESFVANLHQFFLKMATYIEQHKLFRDFYDFCELLTLCRSEKQKKGHQKIFDCYISMLMQQSMYFTRSRLEYSVSGVSNDGTLLMHKNPHAFSDLGAYNIEKYLFGKKIPTADSIRNAYKPFYDISSFQEIESLDCIARVYDNNIYSLIPYITENSLDIIVNEPYQHKIPNFPRIWKETAFYKERLQARQYMLPAMGITAYFMNAGDIDKIIFREVFKEDRVVLLYHVFTYRNGEMSGFYDSGYFYSIYDSSIRFDWHNSLENFVLENYFILTCDYVIDRKKNWAIKQTSIYSKFYYPYQVLASYVYKKQMDNNKNTAATKQYHKNEYIEEVKTQPAYIRRLPAGSNASSEALQLARNLGYEVPEGFTFVKRFDYHVRKRLYRT